MFACIIILVAETRVASFLQKSKKRCWKIYKGCVLGKLVVGAKNIILARSAIKKKVILKVPREKEAREKGTEVYGALLSFPITQELRCDVYVCMYKEINIQNYVFKIISAETGRF